MHSTLSEMQEIPALTPQSTIEPLLITSTPPTPDQRPKAVRRSAMPNPATLPPRGVGERERPSSPIQAPLRTAHSQRPTPRDPSRGGGGATRDLRTQTPTTLDLRRAHTRADHLRTLLDRAEAAELPDSDRRLLAAVFERGMTVQDLAISACAAHAPTHPITSSPHQAVKASSDQRVESPAHPLARSHTHPTPAALARALRRRIRNLAARLADPRFIFVLRHQRDWQPKRRAVARACIILGLSQRAAAHELQTSLHEIRQEFHAIHALFASK